MLVRLPIGLRDASQSVLVSCAYLVSFPSDYCYGLVGLCLEVYMDQWDHIMCNIFMRNVVWNGYTLEFALGNAPPLSRFPIALDSARVASVSECLNDATSKFLEKGAMEPVKDGR